MADRPLAAPLAGIKVLEFSQTVMGPTAGLIFAELGADVVKIEPAKPPRFIGRQVTAP